MRTAPCLLLLLALSFFPYERARGETFEELSAAYLEEFPQLAPVAATQLGDHRFDAQLDQVGAAARDRKRQLALAYIKRLADLEQDQLTADQRIDFELLRHELRSQLFYVDEFRQWEWDPLVYTALAGDAIYSLMARDYAPLPQRLRSAAARMEQFPRLLAQVRKTLVPSKVPKVHAETAVKQNRGVLSIIRNMVEPAADQLEAEDRRRLTAAIAIATEAVDAHQSWLETELLPRARGDFRIGQELYDKKLAADLNSSLSRADILARAEKALSDVRAQMYELSKQVYAAEHPYTTFPENASPAYQQAIIRSALEVAYREQPPRDRLVEAARESLARCTEFVRARQLVEIPPDPVEVIVMPEFRRGVSLAYCDSPGPLDVGQKTFYAVSPLPSDWTEKQIQSFLREYNTRSLANLTIHEAMPGHFLQLALSNRHPSLLRRVLASGVFIEGWAVYTEQMMAAAGFRGDDPLMKITALKWYLRGIANAIIDQRIHAGSMTRDDAMRLMIEDTFQEEREAAAKWVRAQLTSAQLSTYFVGAQEHWDLRRAVEARQGDAFSLRDYHDRVLSYGSPPVRYVRQLMLK